MKLASLVLALASLAPTAVAQDVDAWTHREHKALALGGALLQQAGSAVSDWKAAEAFNYDDYQPYLWTMAVTTSYDLAECADGRAFIVRSGEGVDVDLLYPDGAYAYYWTEDYFPCDTPFFAAGGKSDLLDKNRPLDAKAFKKRAR